MIILQVLIVVAVGIVVVEDIVDAQVAEVAVRDVEAVAEIKDIIITNVRHSIK